MKNRKNHEKIFFRIKEAEETLRHSLFLRMPEKEIPSIRQGASKKEVAAWIAEAFKMADCHCGAAREEYGSFFHRAVEDNAEWEKTQNDMSMLDQIPDFWRDILKEEAVLAAYSKVRKLLAGINPLSNLQCSELLLPFGPDYILPSEENDNGSAKRYGMDYLLHHCDSQGRALAVLDEQGNLNSHYAKLKQEELDSMTFDYPEKLRSRSSASSKRVKDFETLCRDCADLKRVMPYDFVPGKGLENRKFLLQLNNLEFFQYARGRKQDGKISSLKHYCHAALADTKMQQQELRAYFRDYQQMISELRLEGYDLQGPNKANPNCCLSLADKIYCRYTLEKVFPFMAVDAMYESVQADKEAYFLKQNLDYISRIMTLPNALSRHLILQMAVDNLKYEYNKMKDRSKMDPTTLGFSFSKKVDPYMHNQTWMNNYLAMIRVLNGFVIPVYDNYFFSILWESVRTPKKKESESETAVRTDAERLVALFELLSTYLNDADSVHELLVTAKYRKQETTQVGTTCSLDTSKLRVPLQDINAGNLDAYDLDTYQACIRTVRHTAKVGTENEDFLSSDTLLALGEKLDRKIQRFFFHTAKGDD